MNRTLDNGNVRLTFRETDGHSLEMEALYRPGSPRPVEHYHPAQEETFEVLDGSLRFNVAGAERTLHAGDRVVIPPGTVHQAWNDAPHEARVRWIVQPPLRTQRFFETVYGLAQDGKTGPNGTPNLLQASLIALDYRAEFVAARPPLLVQNCAFAVLAPLAWALGYRAYYEKYRLPE